MGQPITLVMELFSGFVWAVLGGYIAARISGGSGASGILALCGFTTLMGILSLAFEPPLNEAAIMSVFVMGALTGGYLRARQKAVR